MPQTAENNDTSTATASATFTEEQVNQRVEAARQEEKKKLYGDIESLTQRISQLEPESVRAKQLEAQLAEKSAQLDAIAKARNETGGVDITKVIEETTERTRKAVQGEKDSEISDLRKSHEQLRQELRSKELAAVRSQLIASYGDEIIPSLVVGNDEESLRTAAASSHEQFKAILAKEAAKRGAAAQNTNNAANGGLPPPAGTTSRAGSAPSGGSQLDGFKRGSGNYSAERAKLLADLKARHG